jgi:hypothetical protein
MSTVQKKIRFKQADLYIQIASLICPLTVWAATRNVVYMEYCYYALGMIQVISCLANMAVLKKDEMVFPRIIYEYILALLSVCAILALLSELSIIRNLRGVTYLYFYSVLFVSPGLAALYFGITIAELRKFKKHVNA